ncbi:MAG: hypothetical protein ACLFRD_09625, partial [Nitriliruptoraceae bacterium]
MYVTSPADTPHRRVTRVTSRGWRTLALLASGLLLAGCSGVADAVELITGDAVTSSERVTAEDSEDPSDEPATQDGDDGATEDGGDRDPSGDDREGTGTEQRGDAGDDEDTATGVTPADELELTTCEAERYSVEAPADWHVNDGERIGDCRIFHPEPVEVPDMPRDRDLHWAIALDIDDVPFEDIDLDAHGQVLSAEETTVDGHRALVYERRSSGEGLIPDGEGSYGYLVDLDGQTLIASTYTVGDTDHERDKQLLDRMM